MEDKNCDNKPNSRYTWQQVAEHNHTDSAWVIYNRKVYDVTKWIDKHPGGKEMLVLHAGRDITDTLQSYHPFSELPLKVIVKYEIGTLTGDSEFPEFAKDTGFYRDCREQVGEYFRKRKLDPKDGFPGLWRMCLVFLVATLSYFVMNGCVPSSSYSLPLMVLAGIVFGVCQALPLLHVMHDSSHAAYTKNHRMWGLVGRFTLDWFAGANLSSWLNQHVVGHHIYTNVAGVDPDLPVNFESDMRRIVDRQVLRPIYAWQHIYLPPLYGLLSIKSRLQDFTDTFMRQAKGSIRVNPLSTKSWTLLALSKCFWLTYRILIPIYYLNVPLGMFWTTFAVTELITGWYLAFNFQVSHVSTVCEYSCGKENLTPNLAGEWAVLQVKSSMDYAHGSWFTTFMTGALNYQITHHLFPCVSQYHYPDIAPIIMAICKKYDIKYTVLPSFWDAFTAHIKHLRIMGVSGRSVSVHMG